MQIPRHWIDRRRAGRAAILAMLAVCGIAHAQWVWRDTSGGITYSDAPPPPDVRPDSILHQPTAAPNPAEGAAGSGYGGNYGGTGSAGGNRPDGAPGAEGDARSAKPASAPRSLAEQDADFRKRLADRDKAQQKSAQEQAQADARAAACNEARSYLQTIESGTRLMRPDADGNRSFLDDDQRAAEAAKAQEAIARNC